MRVFVDASRQFIDCCVYFLDTEVLGGNALILGSGSSKIRKGTLTRKIGTEQFRHEVPAVSYIL